MFQRKLFLCWPTKKIMLNHVKCSEIWFCFRVMNCNSGLQLTNLKKKASNFFFSVRVRVTRTVLLWTQFNSFILSTLTFHIPKWFVKKRLQVNKVIPFCTKHNVWKYICLKTREHNTKSSMLKKQSII